MRFVGMKPAHSLLMLLQSDNDPYVDCWFGWVYIEMKLWGHVCIVI